MSRAAHFEGLLRLGDTCLIWSHRLSEWCGHGPMLEEDIALTNIALDVLGQGRLLLSHAAAIEATGRDEDALAYFRDESGFRNFTLAELPNDDYAHTITRNLFLSTYFVTLWTALETSADAQLAAIAGKAVKESRYHLHHAADWTARMGDSTSEARRRIDAALATLWPYTQELFDEDATDAANCAAGISVRSTAIKSVWDTELNAVLAAATLTIPPTSGFRSEGKRGVHSEYLSRLLAEMQSVARAHPGGDVVNAMTTSIAEAARQPSAQYLPGDEADVPILPPGAGDATHAWAILETIADPELSSVSICDLGIVRDVEVIGVHAKVTITPTYSGCPAVDAIAHDIETALKNAQFAPQVIRKLSPAWTSDWMRPAAREIYRCLACREPFDYFKPI